MIQPYSIQFCKKCKNAGHMTLKHVVTPHPYNILSASLHLTFTWTYLNILFMSLYITYNIFFKMLYIKNNITEREILNYNNRFKNVKIWCLI